MEGYDGQALPQAKVQPYDEDPGQRDTPLLEKAWKKNPRWTEEEYFHLRDKIVKHSPLMGVPKTYNILLIGVINSGKSSFINTMFSALRNDLGQVAFIADSEESTTKKFRMYKLRESMKKRAVNVNLCDTKGYEYERNIKISDISAILDGHIKDGYTFDEEPIKISDKHFNKEPTLDDKIHLVALVIDAMQSENLDPAILDDIRAVIKQANEKDIRNCIVMNKVDGLCPTVNEDIRKIYLSDAIKESAEQNSTIFGVNLSNVFPIKCYSDESHVSVAMNVLALHTLELLLSLADNTLESQRGCTGMAALMPGAKEEVAVELLDKPWYTQDVFDPKASEDMMRELTELKPQRIEKLRLCFLGPLGAGKSSFINSVLSVLYGRIMTKAETGGGDRPMTTHYREYNLQKGRKGQSLSVSLVDTMGFMSEEGGLRDDDIPVILDGKTQNVTAFNPSSQLPITETPYPLKSRMHALVLVVNGKTFRDYNKQMILKMKKAMTVAKAQPREMPRIVLVTHLDDLCPHTKDDITNIFRSQQVMDCLDLIHKELQVQKADIFPVCNYVNEVEVDQNKKALVLHVLHQILERAQDYISMAPEEEWERPKGFLQVLMDWILWRK